MPGWSDGNRKLQAIIRRALRKPAALAAPMSIQKALRPNMIAHVPMIGALAHCYNRGHRGAGELL